jgi:tripartite-type tricarboxylate transporter receptor subunit TctC
MKNCVSKKLVLLGLAVAFTLAVVSGAGAQPGEFVKGVLQPLADGFPKRPIVFVTADDPGSREGIIIRTLQKALKDISPVPVLVADETTAQFGTFSKMKDIIEREGGTDGYYPLAVTVFGTTADLFCEPITKETGMDISDMNLFIIIEQLPYVMVQRKNAPWGRKWADMVKYAEANPDKLKYISFQVGSGNDIACEWVLQTLKMKVRKMPQANAQATLSVIGAGEGDFTLTTSTYAQPHWEAGRLDVTMIMGSSVPPPWDKDPNIVTSEAAGLPKIPVGIIAGFIVPKQTPKSHQDWLFKLFKAGASTDLYKQREKTVIGCQISIMDGVAANELKMKFYEFTEPVVRSLGLHIDQKK